MTKPKILLLDGNAIIHRAYHGVPPLSTASGETVHAAYGFALTLLSVLEKFKPEYVVATFDLPGGTFRDEMYQEYKAHRQAAPDDLYTQIPIIKEMVTAFGIPIVEKEGFEADDCIGTLALLGAEKKLEVVIVTGDTDTLQLVNEDVKVFTMRKGIKDTVVYDTDGVVAKYGLLPSQLRDYKGLAGDSSDNIPGVRGVGPKTATGLLQKHQNLEGVYENVAENKGKLLENLLADKENAFLSRDLGTIRKDVPVSLDLEAAKLDDYDQEKAESFLRRYEFFSLIKRLPVVGKAVATGQASIVVAPKKRKGKEAVLKTKEEVEEFFVKMQKEKLLSLVTEEETASLFGSGLSAIALYSKEGGSARILAESKEALSALNTVLQNKDITLILFDAKKNLHLLAKSDIRPSTLPHDVQLLAYICEIHYDKVLSSLCDVLGVQREVAAKDLYALCQVLLGKLEEISKGQDEKKNVKNIYEEMERPLIPALFAMEERGIILNKKTFGDMSHELEKSIEKIAQEIHKLAGKEFNINSPKQLAEVLFTDLGISADGIKKTKTGISTASAELEKLAEYPIAKKIEEYRELFKLKSTYLDAFPLLTDEDSRLHTTYQQTVAATGRLSSLDPNLQNIPAKGEWSERVRGAFEPTPGFVLVGADYSQIELRIMAHLSGDKELTRAFLAGEDVHQATASVVYKVTPEAVTPEMRRQAKVFNFGLMYGMGAYGLSQAAGITQAEAKEFITLYFEKFSGVKKYIDRILKETKETGYQETELGRRRHIPEIQSSNNQVMKAGERMAVNMPIQGLEADIVKLAMLDAEALIQEEFSGEVNQLLQVHDEIIFEAKKEVAERFAQRLKERMEKVYALSVPLTVEVSIGDNWGEI